MCAAKLDEIYMIFQGISQVWRDWGGFVIGFWLEIYKNVCMKFDTFMNNCDTETMRVAEVDDIYMIFQRDFTVWQGFGGFAIGFWLEIHKTYQIGRFL